MRGSLAQAIAWDGARPVARGMVLFPEHAKYSASAEREACAEVRDVFVIPDRRRGGAATAVMSVLEAAARDAGMARVGLSVSSDDDAAPARALYSALGYRFAHGPYVTSTVLQGDDGPIPVGGVLTYLVKEL
jgi:GNAT superfamily N-acetyltransferase